MSHRFLFTPIMIYLPFIWRYSYFGISAYIGWCVLNVLRPQISSETVPKTWLQTRATQEGEWERERGPLKLSSKLTEEEWTTEKLATRLKLIVNSSTGDWFSLSSECTAGSGHYPPIFKQQGRYNTSTLTTRSLNKLRSEILDTLISRLLIFLKLGYETDWLTYAWLPSTYSWTKTLDHKPLSRTTI